MARQLLIDKWSVAKEVHLSTALDLDLTDTTLYRLGRLLITSVRLHDVGLVGGKEPVGATTETPSNTEASLISAELASLGLPTTFGKKIRGEAKRTPAVLKRSRFGNKGDRLSGSGSRKSSGGSAQNGAAATGCADTPWLQGFDEQWGLHYYYNTQTQESTWETPADGFVPWAEASGSEPLMEESPMDASEPSVVIQQQQVLADANTGEDGGASGSEIKEHVESRGPSLAPRMLTEEDVLRAMGLFHDGCGPEDSGVDGAREKGRHRGQAASITSSPDDVQATAASVGAGDERFNVGGDDGSNGPGAGILRNLLLRPPASPTKSSSVPTLAPHRVVPPTAMSEEQLLARLSLHASSPMPMPPPAPVPPPPSPPPPVPFAEPMELEDTLFIAPGASAPVASSEPLASTKTHLPRMLTEEDILRSMGLLPDITDPREQRNASGGLQPMAAPGQACAAATESNTTPGIPAAQFTDDTSTAGKTSPPPMPPIESQMPSQQNGTDMGSQEQRKAVQQSPSNATTHLQHQHQHQQPHQGGPCHTHSSGAARRLPPGFHSATHIHSFGQYPHQHYLHHHHRPHPPHELAAPPLPFCHGNAAGMLHMGSGPRTPRPPPGFGHPAPLPTSQPPADMWPSPEGPFGQVIMPVMPPPPPPLLPHGFGLPTSGPGMQYGPPSYAYEGNPYPPYGMLPYGMPPGLIPDGRPPLPPLPPPLPPFALDGFPPQPGAPLPSEMGPLGALPPDHRHKHHHHHHHYPNHSSHLHDYHHLQQQNHPQSNGQVLIPHTPSQPALPSGSKVSESGHEGVGHAQGINRKAVTWTLQELERQLEIMAVADDGATRAMLPQDLARQEGEEGSGRDSNRGNDRDSIAADDHHKRLKGKHRSHLHHHGGHAAAIRGPRTQSGGGAAEVEWGGGGGDDSAFYDTFANGGAAAAAAAAAAVSGTAPPPPPPPVHVDAAAKPMVGEDDGTRRIMLDASTAAYVRTLLPRNAAKYWMQRYSLFSRFDSLVQLDTEGWWSVTPEVLAAHQAVRSRELCARGLVALDACCGCGGNVIQMAGIFPVVIGVEISPKRVEMARHNAGIYEVESKCQFLCADFFKVAPSLKVDALFMSPPWGGPKYQHVNTFDVFFPLIGFNKSLLRLLDVAMSCVHEQDGVVAAFLPRNTDLVQLAAVVPEHAVWEVERAYVNNKLKGITLYCHAGRTPEEPNVRLEAETEFSVQATSAAG